MLLESHEEHCSVERERGLWGSASPAKVEARGHFSGDGVLQRRRAESVCSLFRGPYNPNKGIALLLYGREGCCLDRKKVT